MSETKPEIPAAMLFAAANAVEANVDNYWTPRAECERIAQAVLEAAGIPEHQDWATRLEAATKAVNEVEPYPSGHSGVTGKAAAQLIATAALEAAGIAELMTRITELERQLELQAKLHQVEKTTFSTMKEVWKDIDAAQKRGEPR